jgi:hypothetical protein
MDMILMEPKGARPGGKQLNRHNTFWEMPYM